MNRRKALTVTACVAGAAVLVTGGILVGGQSTSEASAETISQTVKTSTGTVEKGDLSGTSTKTGVLGRTPGTAVPGGPSGTLTKIPDIGATINPRDELYRVDDLPITYFAGSLPQWRAFEAGMADGPDVEQLERNLHAWGYLTESPTAHFDWLTLHAIRRWQHDTGQKQTGSIEMGRIWFGVGAHVVSDHQGKVGGSTGAGSVVYATTGTGRVVTVDLPVGSSLATKGGKVAVSVPGAGRLSGEVAKVGSPETDDKGKTTVPVTIRFDDPKKVGDLDRVDVSVEFVSETRENALSVPVLALGAKAGGGFSVDILRTDGATTTVPVEVGLFAGDRVEITGGDVKPGQKVVVPA